MSNTTTSLRAETGTTVSVRSALRATTIYALAAAAINLLLWVIGRAAGAGFVVDPGLGPPNFKVAGIKVLASTLIPFAVGVLVLLLAARRSRRWAITVGVVGALIAAGSAAGPLAGAHDTATGVLLASMHLITGAAFLASATRFGAPRAARGA